MGRTRVKNIILLAISTFIAVSTTIITVSSVIAHGNSSVGGTANGFQFFRYFTSDSNVLLAVISILVAIKSLRNILQNQDEMANWLVLLYLVGATGTTVTFLTTTLFLTPLYTSYGYGFFYLYKGSMFFMHLLNPILAIVVVVFLLEGMTFNIKHVLLSTITVVLYSFIYAPMVLLKKWSDFYGFTFGGKVWVTPLSILMMYAAAFGIAFLLALFHNLHYKRVKGVSK